MLPCPLPVARAHQWIFGDRVQDLGFPPRHLQVGTEAEAGSGPETRRGAQRGLDAAEHRGR
jgi:hypothetical protein